MVETSTNPDDLLTSIKELEKALEEASGDIQKLPSTIIEVMVAMLQDAIATLATNPELSTRDLYDQTLLKNTQPPPTIVSDGKTRDGYPIPLESVQFPPEFEEAWRECFNPDLIKVLEKKGLSHLSNVDFQSPVAVVEKLASLTELMLLDEEIRSNVSTKVLQQFKDSLSFIDNYETNLIIRNIERWLAARIKPQSAQGENVYFLPSSSPPAETTKRSPRFQTAQQGITSFFDEMKDVKDSDTNTTFAVNFSELIDFFTDPELQHKIEDPKVREQGIELTLSFISELNFRRFPSPLLEHFKAILKHDFSNTEINVLVNEEVIPVPGSSLRKPSKTQN